MLWKLDTLLILAVILYFSGKISRVLQNPRGLLEEVRGAQVEKCSKPRPSVVSAVQTV